MKRLLRASAYLSFAALLTWGFSLPAAGQEAAPSPAGQFRKLAPGVMETAVAEPEVDETVSRHDVVELLAVNAGFDWAKDVPFRREIWNLEFRFKPVRMIYVDIPQPGDKMERKLIWYLVYSVTNREVEEKTWYMEYDPATQEYREKVLAGGGDAAGPPPRYGWMEGVEIEDGPVTEKGAFRVRFRNKPIRFIPEFRLETSEPLEPGEEKAPRLRVYPDRVIPVAFGPIRIREDAKRSFISSAQVVDVKPGDTVWGIATWEGLNPRIDRFSIYVNGLTNAYRWKDDPQKYAAKKTIGAGRSIERKVLKINFWRPGDEYYENEKEIRYGHPGEVDYEWLYR